MSWLHEAVRATPAGIGWALGRGLRTGMGAGLHRGLVLLLSCLLGRRVLSPAALQRGATHAVPSRVAALVLGRGGSRELAVR